MKSRLAYDSKRILKVPQIVELLSADERKLKDSNVPIDQPIFEPFPPEITLQSFDAFKKYEVLIFFRNNDKTARKLQLEQIDSPFFSVSGVKNPSLKSGKVAPGMDVPFVITFSPEEERDYSCQLVCISEREKFIVPIQANCQRALLDFPDQVKFPESPVRYKTTRTLLIRNIGKVDAQFFLETEEPFQVDPQNGFLSAGQHMQINIDFNSIESGHFCKDLKVKLSTGETLSVLLMGCAENVDVRLESNSMIMESTYIGLKSSKTIKIFNRSEIMATFKWKRFATDGEEKSYRERMKWNLNVNLPIEVEEIDRSLIERKRKNEAIAFMNDPLLVNDPIFVVDPPEGVIWPNKIMEIKITFAPRNAGMCSAAHYCELSGRETRIPLILKGEAIGPKARFNYDILDIDQIFIGTSHKYEVRTNENKGEINFKYNLKPHQTNFSSKFEFTPNEGTLKVCEQQKINIMFKPDIIGEFLEEFSWNIEGSRESLKLIAKGRVVGPTFHFDLPKIDFGGVSYNFRNSKKMELFNTSDIPMEFKLRVSSDIEANSDFAVLPDSGFIEPCNSQKIQIEFTPTVVKRYESVLIIDLEGVGRDMMRIPVIGESFVPEIQPVSPLIECGDLFINYPYIKTVTIQNTSKHWATYEIQTQEDSAKSVFSYNAKCSSGIIKPQSVENLKLDIELKRLGQVNFPVFIKILGQEELFSVEICANGVGPHVFLSAEELNWGKINVLTESEMIFTMTNDSPIMVNYNCTTVSDQSVFQISPCLGNIAPGCSTEFRVNAFLDDSLKFTDILKIAILNGEVHELQLVARGQGTTIVFDEALRNVDFANIFSNKECIREFTLTNKGRRSQTLMLMIDEKRAGPKEMTVVSSTKFDIYPSRFVLKPGGSQTMTIKASSAKAIQYKETLVCFGIIEKDPTKRVIFEGTITANFITPMIECTPPWLKFVSAHTNDDEFRILSQDIELRNATSLPLTMSFKCPLPYTLLPSNSLQLMPNESFKFEVLFDPSYNINRVSCNENAKIAVLYQEHPQRDYIDLSSQIAFPNLEFSGKMVNFGCVLQHTEQKKTFVMTNSSTLPVDYFWSFMEESIEFEGVTDIRIEQIFDIFPMSGLLMPGESETVYVSFYGYPGGSFRVNGVCNVSGGPKYQLPLSGEASTIEYQIDKIQVDFGMQLYQDITEQEIVLSNSGLVTFDFNCAIYSSSKLLNKITITPSAGTIQPHGKQKVTIRFCPCVPEEITDRFYITVAHFEAFPILVNGIGIFPELGVGLPRIITDDYSKLRDNYKAKPNFSKLYDRAGEIKDGAGSFLSEFSPKVTGKLSVDYMLDSEVESILLTSLTDDYLKDLTNELKIKNQPGTKQKFIGSPLIMHKCSQAKVSKDKKVICSITDSSSIKLSSYLCDFGNVIKNTSKRKAVRIYNRGQCNVSFHLEKIALTGTGFSVEPERVKMLPPQEFVDFQVVFQARSSATELGCTQINLSLYVVGGPTLVLLLKADVTVPELRMSTQDVEFGEVLCGQRKNITVQLHNANSVICEWSSLPAPENSIQKHLKKKDNLHPSLKEFELVPSSGVLQPGEKNQLLIRFFPSDEKVYDITVPIRINLNSKTMPLHLVGRGVKTFIHLEPRNIVMGPILPCSEGTECKVTVYNPTSYPVEIYSTEFDKQYLEEEELMRRSGQFDSGPLFIAPREPGQPLPEFILESIARKDKTDTDGKNIISDTTVGDLLDTTVSNTRVNQQSSLISDVHKSIDSLTVIILYGPPLSGKSTQAARIEKKYMFTVVSIDAVLESATKDEHNEIQNTLPGQARRMPNKENKDFRSSSTQQTNDNDEMLKHIQDIAHEGNSKYECLTEEIIQETIKNYLMKESYSRGIVVDGLESKFTSNTVAILKGLIRGIPDKKKCNFVLMNLDPVHIKSRELNIQKFVNEKEMGQLSFVRNVSDEEYEAMTEKEKENYDSAYIKYKRKLKEFQEKQKMEKRLWEEELSQRLGEKKIEEEGKGRKRQTLKSRQGREGKSEGNQNSGKMDLKPIQKDKGSITPKIQKRQEKGDKFEKSEKDIEENSSRFTLNDTEFLYNEKLFKRLESYQQNLENVLTLIKEGDKPSVNRVVPSTAPEKKPNKGKFISAPYAVLQESAALSTSLNDSEQHSIEERQINFHEVDASADEETCFKFLAGILPTPQNFAEANNAEVLPEAYIEQMVSYPHERQEAYVSKSFVLMPPVNENEEELSANVIEQLPVVSGKAETGKKSKLSQQKPIIIEDNKIDELDDLEKNTTAKYRWTILPQDKKELHIKFSSNEIGKFEQNLNFEIVGSKGKFSVNCIGICQYSQIVTDYRRVFQKSRKAKEHRMILHGEYVCSSNSYEFGPLLYSKPREKYPEKFPENRAILNIINPTNTEIKVNFFIRNDVKNEVFFFDPPAMDIQPQQSQNLQVWAYPRQHSYFEDMLIICVKDNPEPICYKISCIGVKPELEIDKKTLSFDKLLLNRTEHRELKLKNPTWMVIAWRLVGLDLLGDEFQVSPAEGVIEPFQEVVINADFKGVKPVVVKKVIRVEVSDPDRIGGVFQEYTIVISAEAYDIAMDLHFPKAYYGGLDFGTLKVFEEGKQTCSLKNKGKYEVGFKFLFESKEYSELFTISPQQGIMQPSDKPFPVQIMFKAQKEMHFKDIAALKCQFYEPITGEVTASIPIKLCARAVYSKFSILPARELNFGALVHGTKVSRQFSIENLGEFDFRFSIFKLLQGIGDGKLGASKLRTNSRASKTARATSPPTSRTTNKKEPLKQADATNFGPFTVFPTNGVIMSGSKQQITVEFHSDTPGGFDETIALDISDRCNTENEVLEYKLVGESCIPGINTSDFISIFEEQSVCKRFDWFANRRNIYSEEDRAFNFGAYLVGHQAQVRIKISNPYKVPCEVILSTRPRSRTKSDSTDFAFDVEPKRLAVPNHEHRYVSIAFHPVSIQSYSGTFEAVVENVAESKSKILTFELKGEGTLPKISIEKPTTVIAGVPNLKFRKLLIGNSQVLPIVLRNDGIITAQFKMELNSKDIFEFNCKEVNMYHTLQPQSSVSFDIACKPSAVKKLEGELRIKVTDNFFEDEVIKLSGEGYLDDITFENLPEESENEIILKDCPIGMTKQLNFSVANNSFESIRVVWSESTEFQFSPNVCHIKPKSSKEVTMSFTPKQPGKIVRQPSVCKTSKIKYLSQKSSDFEWDDRMKIVRWVTGEKGQLSRKIVELCPEPNHETINPPVEYCLLTSAFADFCQYECAVSSINFKTTFMYQTRVYRFPFKNTSSIQLHYEFMFVNKNRMEIIENSEECPFSVIPKSGTIAAGETVVLIVKFSPTDVDEYSAQLFCNIPNLVRTCPEFNIAVRGHSERPFCHLELEENDYISSERRNPEIGIANGIPTLLEPTTRVLEFFSCGVKVRNTKRFYILNPTEITYEFEINCLAGNQNQVFKCGTPRGTVSPNRKHEIVFEFTPEQIEIQESLWRFSILEYAIQVPILVVGNATEPKIILERSGINFKSVLVGRQVKESVKLVNNEKIPFAYSFNETSFDLSNQNVPVLSFHPAKGTIAANGEIIIDILFAPSSEKIFNFNLLCNIKKKPTPLTLNVKGEGYKIHESILSELADGKLFELSSSMENSIDFGQVQLLEKRIKRIMVVNSGKFNFDFMWKITPKLATFISINPEVGTVGRGERFVCEMSFLPAAPISLKNLKVLLQIVNGRSYPLLLSGTGCKPLLKFSKISHDFGTEFVYKTGMTPSTTTVRVTNEDVKDVSLELLLSSAECFEVQKGATHVSSGGCG
ncbi:hypothetical protein HK098_001757 [Nowakowskiella sp. JEL0407]|nr:hypothetical protein HK098_001757 [Nowakowskiella sp. JEL0407]